MRPDDDACPLSIRLFGAFEARAWGRPFPRLRFRRSQSVLALLALRQGREVERDLLAGLLWPESPASAALHGLRNCLTGLRSALGPEAGRLRLPNSRTLALDLTEVFVDVLTFDAAIARGGPAALEEAVSLYRGPFLEGCAEEWAFQERQRREQAYLTALEELARLALARGETAAAERHLRMAVAADPLRESAQRALMDRLAAGGNYAAALLAYRELRQRLHRELNAEPDPETQALFQRLRAAARAKAEGGTRRRGYGENPGTAPSRRNGPAAWISSKPAAPQAVGRAEPAAAAGPDTFVLPRSLPLPLTRFFGRQPEIARLRELLLGGEGEPGTVRSACDAAFDGGASSRPPVSPSPRLITLTGPGGSGKTRLALQVGEALREAYAEAVWFVPLLALLDPRLLPGELLHALRLTLASPIEPLAQVAAALSARPGLLILDNFEQIVDGGSACIQTLLEQARSLTILVTSRQCLGVPGEREFPVAPLPVPTSVDSGQWMVDSSDPADAGLLTTIHYPLSTFPSVQLFVDRAQAARPDFQLTAGNVAAVADLCRRLEGIPLAIELAAARVRVLTPAQMLERLAQRFELLVGRQRAGDPRHHSLRVTLDWSYQLLSPELQRFFAQLSVFRGGWTLEAAEAVCGNSHVRCSVFGAPDESDPGRTPNPQHRIPTLEYLEELQQCSLVETESVGEEMRYHLLETLREYGTAQLSTEERAAMAQRHLTYFMGLAWEGEPALTGRPLPHWLDRMEREHDNLRAALSCMVQGGTGLDLWALRTPIEKGASAPVAGHFVRLLLAFWTQRGYQAEARGWVPQVVAMPGAPVSSIPRAWLLGQQGILAQQQGDFAEAGALLQQSLAIYQELGHKGDRWCCRLLGGVARDQGDYARARAYYQQLMPMAREAGDQCEIACGLYGMGYTAFLEGDLETAQPLLEEALRIFRDMGDEEPLGIAWACAYMGELADACGDYPAAAGYLDESLALMREHGFLWGQAHVLHKLGRLAQHQGQWTAVAAHITESLKVWKRIGNKKGIVECLEGLAAVAAGRNQPERAARLLGAAAALREGQRVPVPPVERTDLERVTAGARVDLGETRFAAAWAAGQAMALEHVVDQALKGAPAGCSSAIAS